MQRAPMDWTGAVVFVGLAYGISWTWMFIVPVIGIPLWTIGLSSFGPAIAAVLVRGPLLHEGFRQSGLGLATPPGRAWTYLFALLIPPLIVVIGAALLIAGGDAQLVPGQWHDPYQGQDYFFAAATGQGASGLLLVFLISPLVSFEAFGEEFGWRGYLFPKLMPLGPLAAAILSGVVWTFWHVPGYLLYTNEGWITFILFAGTSTFGGTLLCWLRLRARSVWPAAIWHEAYNNQGPALAGLLTPTGMSIGQLTSALPAFVGIFELLAFAYLFIWGRMVRAAEEDHVVWTSLLTPRSKVADVTLQPPVP